MGLRSRGSFRRMSPRSSPLAQKSATAIDWHRESPLLQHVSFDEVIFMEDPVTAAGKDETAFANLDDEILALGPSGPLALLRSEGENARIHLPLPPAEEHAPLPRGWPLEEDGTLCHQLKKSGFCFNSSPAY